MDALISGDLPFEVYQLGEDEGRIELMVPHADVAAVVTHFDEHPVTLTDGTVVPVDVSGLAGGGFVTEPADPTHTPKPLEPSKFLGLEVHEAARRATDAGWLVRAYEPEAALTADYRTNRMNLCYSTAGIVIRADIG